MQQQNEVRSGLLTGTAQNTRRNRLLHEANEDVGIRFLPDNPDLDDFFRVRDPHQPPIPVPYQNRFLAYQRYTYMVYCLCLNHPAKFDPQPTIQPSLRLQAWLAGPQNWLDSQRENGRTDGQTDGRTENLPILQDFVPIGAAKEHLHHSLSLN